MMTKAQAVLNELNHKIHRLLSVCEQMRTDRAMLQLKVAECEVQIADLNEQMKAMEERNKKLQLARAFETSVTDTRDAKLKIGRIVREIDKCMALLNK
jgi:predicted  nucleic acid-binding Zn-ribbon protein